MEDKAIDQMIRIQYDIPDDKPITIEFMPCVGKKYTFEVSDCTDHDKHITVRKTIVEVQADTKIISLD